jgi:hypothetical protein
MDCILCGASAQALSRGARDGRAYYRCPACGLLFLDPGQRLSALHERERYLLHRNSLEEAGYRSWLESFADLALLPFLGKSAKVLDYGSGPTPCLCALLRDAGLEARAYDPFFAPQDPGPGPYDAVACVEALEHMSHPATELGRMASLLGPGGILAIRTQEPPEEEDAFLSWWYRQDSTHIAFYTPSCLRGACGSMGIVEELSSGDIWVGRKA